MKTEQRKTACTKSRKRPHKLFANKAGLNLSFVLV